MLFPDRNLVPESLRKAPDPAVLAWPIRHDAERFTPSPPSRSPRSPSGSPGSGPTSALSFRSSRLESVTPRRRTPLGGGNSGSSSAAAIPSSSSAKASSVPRDLRGRCGSTGRSREKQWAYPCVSRAERRRLVRILAIEPGAEGSEAEAARLRGMRLKTAQDPQGGCARRPRA